MAVTAPAAKAMPPAIKLPLLREPSATLSSTPLITLNWFVVLETRDTEPKPAATAFIVSKFSITPAAKSPINSPAPVTFSFMLSKVWCIAISFSSAKPVMPSDRLLNNPVKSCITSTISPLKASPNEIFASLKAEFIICIEPDIVPVIFASIPSSVPSACESLFSRPSHALAEPSAPSLTPSSRYLILV